MGFGQFLSCVSFIWFEKSCSNYVELNWFIVVRPSETVTTPVKFWGDFVGGDNMLASLVTQTHTASSSYAPNILSASSENSAEGTLSKTLKASLISSSLSVSFIFLAIMVRNSGKSMVPLPLWTRNQNLVTSKTRTAFLFRISLRFGFSPSASTSLIMSWSSASVGFWPRERITVPSSLVVMVPSPSLSNSENASLNSAKRKIQGTFPQTRAYRHVTKYRTVRFKIWFHSD